MNASRIPGFTAAASLATHKAAHPERARGRSHGSSVVIPQLSCWRFCYEGSSTNHELVECFRACQIIKNTFPL